MKRFIAGLQALPPQAIRLLLLIATCTVFGIGGTQMTISSYADSAPKTIEYDFVTYEDSVSDGNRIGGVKITTAAGPSGTTCSETTGTTDGARGDNYGHVHLKCKTAKDGGSKEYKFVNAEKDGYHLSSHSPHNAGDPFHVTSTGNNTFSVVLEKDVSAPAPAPVAPAPDPTPSPAPAPDTGAARRAPDGTPDGTVTIATYVGNDVSGKELSGVKVGIAPGGSHVVCRAVDVDKGESVRYVTTGSNGRDSAKCPAGSSDGKSRAFQLSSVSLAGYHISASSPHQLTGDSSTITVEPGKETVVHIVLDSDTAAAAEPTVPRAPQGTPKRELEVITYVGSIKHGNEIGGVAIATKAGGSNIPCIEPSGTTDNDRGHSDNYGHVHLTCWTANDGDDRTYILDTVSLAGYSVAGSSPHKPGEEFRVGTHRDNILSIILNPNSGTPSAPSPSGGSGSSAPAPTPAPNTPRPESQKNGSVQVTTYVMDSDGKRTRLPGVTLHIQSVGYPVDDSTSGCSDHNQTTKSASGDNYGQAHFGDCWTGGGSDGAKNYQLSFVQLPAGYAFKSFHVADGGKFISGKTSSTDGIEEQFNVRKNQETKLEVVLQKVSTTVQPSKVQQVISRDGIRYVPADDSDAAKKAAAAMNAITQGGRSPSDVIGDDINEDSEDDDGSDVPPTSPKNFTAVEDSSGSVSLNWEASTGVPINGAITYDVARAIKDSADDPDDVETDIEGLSTIDASDDLEYPKTYIYQVVANDENGNTSDVASFELTTVPVASNVPGEDDPADPSDPTDPTDPASTDPAATTPGTAIPSTDNNVSLTVPGGASDNDVACAVNDDSSVGDDVLDDLGSQLTPTYQPVCRDDQGNVDDEFSDDVDLDFEYDMADDGEYTDEDYEDADLYGYDGTDWEELSVDDADEDTPADDAVTDNAANSQGTLKYTSVKKTKKNGKIVYTVKTKHLFAITLVKHTQSNSLSPIIPTMTLIMVLVGGLGVREMIQRRYIADFYNYGPEERLSGAIFSEEPVIEATPEVHHHYQQVHETISPLADTPHQPTPEGMVAPDQQQAFVVHPNRPHTEDDPHA